MEWCKTGALTESPGVASGMRPVSGRAGAYAPGSGHTDPVAFSCPVLPYLTAAPKVLWVSPETIAELLINSNVDWSIT